MSTVIKGETLIVYSEDLYEELKNKEGIRDILYDGRTLHIDEAIVKDCVIITDGYEPDSLYEDL